MKGIIKYLKGALCVAALAVAGCTSSYNSRADFDIIYYDIDLGRKLQTTPVHPDDTPFLTGETEADLDSGWDMGIKGGLEGKFGSEKVKVKAGADVRFNFSSLNDNYRCGIHRTEQQESDPRPENTGSHVFTQLTPDYFNYIPFVGIEGNVNKDFKLGLELGFPYSGFKFRSGHDRYSRWDAVKKDEWNGFGTRISGNLECKMGYNSWFNFSLAWESYKPEFEGEKTEIDGYMFGVGIKTRF